MGAKVSVVVPIYNVEKYLPNCVETLRNQTLKDLEIILVDDGSPDRSGALADEYASQDKRIKVIHQKNMGLGPARNSGINAADGEYIAFVDSDDWVTLEMFERLYSCAVKTGADIVTGGHRVITDGVLIIKKVHPLAGKTFVSPREVAMVRKNLYGHSVDDFSVDPFPMTAWGAVYKRELIQRFHLEFENILSEDAIFNLSAYKYAKSLSFTDGTDYCYRKDNQPSIMKTFSDEKYLKYISFLKRLNEMAAQEEDKECVIRAKRTAIDYTRPFIRSVSDSNLTAAEKKKAIAKYAENTDIQNYWSGYPVSQMPWRQKIFQQLLLKRYYGTALILNDVWMALKWRKPLIKKN